MLSRLRKDSESQEPMRQPVELTRRAIASVLNLSAQVIGGSAQNTTETVFQLYGRDQTGDSQVNISGLHLRGDFPAMNFSNLTVIKSSFSGYKKLLSCKFQNSQFMYCSFDLCFDPSARSSSLDPQSLDQTCELGDLREFLTLARAGKKDENRLVEAEAKKFLHSFFKGDRFIDNRKRYVRFSTKVPGLADNKFDRVIAAGYLAVKCEKEIADFYEIDDKFKPSVRRLLTDNYTDAAMRKFFSFLRSN